MHWLLNELSKHITLSNHSIFIEYAIMSEANIFIKKSIKTYSNCKHMFYHISKNISEPKFINQILSSKYILKFIWERKMLKYIYNLDINLYTLIVNNENVLAMIDEYNIHMIDITMIDINHIDRYLLSNMIDISIINGLSDLFLDLVCYITINLDHYQLSTDYYDKYNKDRVLIHSIIKSRMENIFDDYDMIDMILIDI